MIIELQHRGHIQRMVYDEFERRVRDGQISPEVPIRFDAVTGDQFVPVGQLELYRELLNPQRRAFREQLRKPGFPIMTAILVGVQIRIYLMSWAPDLQDWLETEWTQWAPGILEHAEIYRLFSYGVVHVGFTHLLFNLTFLAYTGYNLERALGSINLLLLFFGSVFSGGLLSMWMAPGRPSLGASGGDFGLIAAAVVFGWKHWDDIPRHAQTKFGWALVPYLGFSLISGLGSENIDNWSHLGGLVGGAVLMTILSPALSVENKRRNRIIQRASVGLMALLSIGLIRWGPHLVPLQDQSQGSWTVPVPSYWRPGWTFTGDRGWFSPTADATMAVTRTIHDRPISNVQAVQSMLDRLSSAGTTPKVTERSTIQIGEHEGTHLTMRLMLSGVPTELQAVVMTRGVVTYRANIQSQQQTMSRYATVFSRALSNARLDPPETLQAAQERAAAHPRSWQPAIDLGNELYRAGRPIEAVAAYRRALSISPEQNDAWLGLLRTHTFYDLPKGLAIADEALARPNATARVIVAAADLLDSVGANQKATQALNQAWQRLPGNGIVRRARIQRGLQVDP